MADGGGWSRVYTEGVGGADSGFIENDDGESFDREGVFGLHFRTVGTSLTNWPVQETPGFLYAYELRGEPFECLGISLTDALDLDLQTSSTSFFKVGRTDNVARRIGEWTTRESSESLDCAHINTTLRRFKGCRTHTPTLRDIFPLSARPPFIPSASTDLQRKPSASMSYLPGALPHSPTKRPLPAVKRWERLVHLELADRSSSSAPRECLSVREKCKECDAVHREIFPFGRTGQGGERVYEDVISEVVERWGRFIRRICRDEG